MATAAMIDRRAARAAFEARARELAEMRHTTGTVQWQGDPMSTWVVTVPSRSRAGVEYRVAAPTADHWTCSCPAIGPCCHIGAAMRAFEQRERAMSPDGQQWTREYLAWCDDHGF